MRPLSLKTQYIGGICGLILFVSLTLLLYVHMEFNKQLRNELNKRGISIARNLAEASVEPIITENSVALQLLVNDLKKNEIDIRYIYIVNKKQQIIAHTFGQSFPRDLLKTDRLLPVPQETFIQSLQTEEESLTDVTATIHKGDFGRAHIGLSGAAIEEELNKVVSQGLPFIALIILLASAAAWWFAVRITKPVAALVEGVRSVGEGMLGASIDIKANDEIGELARAFNRMVNDLQLRRAERLQAEEMLRLQTGRLEDEVAERQLAQKALAAKQLQLECLNNSLEDRVNHALNELRVKDKIMMTQGRQAAMGEMINNIAHQWRQPLNNLGLVVQNIKADYDHGTLTPETLTADIEKTMNTIIFMSHTINDFSSFFCNDRVKQTFQIYLGITKVLAMIEASLSKQGIKLVIEQRDKGVSIEGYFNEYNQVLLILLNNAKDALLERGVEHPVIAVSISRNGEQAIVRISDNAGGIPEEIIELIFDPYFTTKEHGKGSGIGLYLSKSIIEEHFGGTLTAANIDSGTEFTVSAPCAKDEA